MVALGDGAHVAGKTPAIPHPLPTELKIAASLHAEACRCFSLIKGVINTCQSKGLGREGGFHSPCKSRLSRSTRCRGSTFPPNLEGLKSHLVK